MASPSFVLPIRVAAFLLLTGLLLWVEVTVLHSTAFRLHPTGISLAILFDLVFVTVGLFYGLIARPFRLANSRLILVALFMVRVALAILPETALPSAYVWPTLLVLAEGTVLVIAVARIRTIVQTYRRLRPTTDFETALHDSLAVVFGNRGAGFILGEGLVVYYTFMGWRLRSDLPDGAHDLTTHRQSGQLALQLGLLLVGLIEGVATHLLISRWSADTAFWITVLSGYGMLFFVADLVATLKRPSYLTNNHLHLRLGIRWRATVPREHITAISWISEKPAKKPGLQNGAFLTAPNVLLTFNQPIGFKGPYGIQKNVNQLSLFVDDRAGFAKLLDKIPSQ
ncbi:hypothetical protein [Spirosoma gilvum]